MILIMMELKFLCQKKLLVRLKRNISFASMFFVMKINWLFQIYNSDQKIDNLMDLLLIIDENKSNYVYTKDFDRLMFHKTKFKNKKYFCKSCLQ